MTTLAVGAVLLTVSAACVTDVRMRRIPNWLTFGSAVLAVLTHAMSSDGRGVTAGVMGWLAGVALFLPVFALRGMGGGDVKLLGALGAWLGVPNVIWLAAYTSMVGGVLGIVVAVRSRYLGTLVRNVGNLLRFWSLVGIKPLDSLTLEHGTGPRLAYAIPMLVGTVVTIWLH